MQYGSLEGEALMYGEYTCLDCGKTFDDPKRWEERHGLDSPPYEDFSGVLTVAELIPVLSFAMPAENR